MTTPLPHHPITSPSRWHSVLAIIHFELQESLRTRFLLVTLVVFFVGTLIYMHAIGLA
jgi:ABC-2 type transport system permease protein